MFAHVGVLVCFVRVINYVCMHVRTARIYACMYVCMDVQYGFFSIICKYVDMLPFTAALHTAVIKALRKGEELI